MTERKYLTEVQGLRTVAALLVAVYHIWLQRVSGGVDVFFVVSAYFLVAGLMRREPMRLGDLFNQFMSTIRRVVPGTAIVVIGTIIGAYFFLPDPLWGGGLAHGLLSLGFVENWLLAANSVDYLQAGLLNSPFQQMWALSVQMQVLLVLPVIYYACSLIGRRFGGRVVATVVFGMILVASLWISVTYTQRDQTVAYYITPTRVWEFAAGALAALWLDKLRLPSAVARLMGYAGLVVLVTFGLAIDVSRQFPGYIAAVPVLCALLIIAAANNNGNIRPLRHPLVVRLADMSFAFYLWHWPVLIFVRHMMGTDAVGLLPGLGIIAIAGLLAYLSTGLIESPVRRAPWLVRWPVLGVLVAVAFLGLGGASLKGWQMLYQQRVDQAHAELKAYRADPTGRLAPGQLVPDPVISRTDHTVTYYNGCHQWAGREAKSCVHGDEDATLTIALVGGSHIAQWVDLFGAVGEANGFRVVSMTRSGCRFVLDGHNAGCEAWSANAIEELRKIQPQAVVVLATRTSTDEMNPEDVPTEELEVFAALERAGMRVIGMRDNPRYATAPVNCLATHRDDWSACEVPRDRKLREFAVLRRQIPEHVRLIDSSEVLCAATCLAVLDGIVLYQDVDHLTRTFTMTLQAWLKEKLRGLLEAEDSPAMADPA
ncbi:MAG: acyltransferase [Hyphomicrobiales bacterium]|nr:MAG: acyltransferase [Hyphomicrobiales bacterium]